MVVRSCSKRHGWSYWVVVLLMNISRGGVRAGRLTTWFQAYGLWVQWDARWCTPFLSLITSTPPRWTSSPPLHATRTNKPSVPHASFQLVTHTGYTTRASPPHSRHVAVHDRHPRSSAWVMSRRQLRAHFTLPPGGFRHRTNDGFKCAGRIVWLLKSSRGHCRSTHDHEAAQ